MQKSNHLPVHLSRFGDDVLHAVPGEYAGTKSLQQIPKKLVVPRDDFWNGLCASNRELQRNRMAGFVPSLRDRSYEATQ